MCTASCKFPLDKVLFRFYFILFVFIIYFIYRWWVAGHSLQHINIPVSDTLLNDSQQCVQKLRSVIKFLLGAIHDIDEYILNENSVELYALDKYMLHLLYYFHLKVFLFLIFFIISFLCLSQNSFIFDIRFKKKVKLKLQAFIKFECFYIYICMHAFMII